MTSSQHGPYALGCTHATMAANKGMLSGDAELISKMRPQLGSKSATRLRERGIASNRRSAKLR